MDIWDKVKRPPESALKTIRGGRLKGMTDISPQWRYQVMTEVFGPCGIGWGYDITRLWFEEKESETLAFATVELFIKVDGEWSRPIPGVGGSHMVARERDGLYVSDEAYKMAVTDALSVAMKMLGVGSDIYMGKFDGSKYIDAPEPAKQPVKTQEEAVRDVFEDDIPYEDDKPEVYGINQVLRMIDESNIPATKKTQYKEEALKKPEGVLTAWAKGFLEHRLKQEET